MTTERPIFAAYLSRRQEFTEEWKKASTNTVRALLFGAVVSADLSIDTFTGFMRAITGAIQRVLTAAEKRQRQETEIQATIERLRGLSQRNVKLDEFRQQIEAAEKQRLAEAHFAAEDDPEFRALYDEDPAFRARWDRDPLFRNHCLAHPEFRTLYAKDPKFRELVHKLPPLVDLGLSDMRQTLASLENAQAAREESFASLEGFASSASDFALSVEQFQLLVHGLTVEAIEDSLAQIFRSRRSNQILQGAVRFAQYLIDQFSPIGAITANIQLGLDMYKITARPWDTSAAAGPVEKLEAFIASADSWSLTAQIVTDALNAIDDTGDLPIIAPVPFAESQARLDRRKAALVQQLEHGST